MKRDSQAVINVKRYNLSLLVGFLQCLCCFCVLNKWHNILLTFQFFKTVISRRREEKGRVEAYQNTGRDTPAELERMHSILISVIQTIHSTTPESKA